MSTEDRLGEMFLLRERFMESLAKAVPGSTPEEWPLDMSEKKSQRLCRETALKGVEEIFEALSEMRNTKSHRVTENKEFNREKFLEEMVDAFNYFFSLLILSGFSDADLFEAYVRKDEIIHKRITSGY